MTLAGSGRRYLRLVGRVTLVAVAVLVVAFVVAVVISFYGSL